MFFLVYCCKVLSSSASKNASSSTGFFNKILSRWQKLWSRWRRKKLTAKGQLVSLKVQVSGKILKSGPLRMEQN